MENNWIQLLLTSRTVKAALGTLAVTLLALIWKVKIDADLIGTLIEALFLLATAVLTIYYRVKPKAGISQPEEGGKCDAN
jgi:hypothetical protein